MIIWKINLNTLRENPSAGNTTYHVPGREHTDVSVGENGEIQVTKTREYHTLRSMIPEPAWLYEREPLEVECQHCHAKIQYGDVEEDWDILGDGDEVHVTNICPVCKASDCLSEEVEWETVEEALKRKANENHSS